MQLPRFFDFSDPEKQAVLLAQFLEKGGSLQEILRISSESLETLYAKAYNNFQNHYYTKARQLFAFLSLVSPGITKYWWGLGAVQVALEDYRSALASYTVLSFLDPNNPQPHFFAAFCYQRLGKHKEAATAFEKGTSLKRQEKL